MLVSGTADCCKAGGLIVEAENTGPVRKVLLKNSFLKTAPAGLVSLSLKDVSVRKDTRAWVQAETMCGIVGFQPAADGLRSYGCIGFPATEDAPARLVAVLDLRRVTAWIELNQQVDGLEPVVIFDLDQVELAPGEERVLPDVVVLEGSSLSDLFEQYGKMSGESMDARASSETIFGWCSWYHYYGHETEADVLANARELKENGVLPEGSVIQIDDGWNRTQEDAPRNWGDWMPGSKFARGMQAVADDLHASEFKAGIWLAPFSVDAASELALVHSGWMLNPEGKKLLETGVNPVCGLDLTHPGVLEFIDETFERVFNEWGFDYVKLDFLHHAMAEGPRYDLSLTRTEALHNALQRIRRIAGDDRFILCCGCPFGPAVGVADAMRIGFDVGSRWHAPMLTELWPHGNCSIKPAAYSSIYQQWMNGQWWLNDPDCLIVRSRATRYEVLQFDENHPGGNIPADAFGLTEEEAGFWARLVYATGTFFMLSEVWNELSVKQQELIRKSFCSGSSRFRMVDMRNEELLMMCDEAERSIALFNLSDKEMAVEIPAQVRLGAYVEVFSNELWHVSEACRLFPEIPPHAGRIWTLKK